MHPVGDLLEIIEAGGPLAVGFGAAQGWQQHRGKNTDDPNNHQQFEQGKCIRASG
jgi:hypothetical protein